jgi:excisionase family DNA binding protein
MMAISSDTSQTQTMNLVNRNRSTLTESDGTVGCMPRILVSVTETARILGISRSYAYELVSSGFLGSVKLGRRVLVPVTAIEELVACGQAEF